VSIDDDVLAEVGFAIETIGVWWGWLVNGPVVVWWVLDWVSNLEEGGGVESSGGVIGSVGTDVGSHISSDVCGQVLGHVGAGIGGGVSLSDRSDILG